MPLAIVTMSGTTSEVLESPVVLAGSAESGLHLVGDAQAAVLADDRVRFLQIFGAPCVAPPTPWIGSAMNAAILPGVEKRIRSRMSSALFVAISSGVPVNGLRYGSGLIA